MNWTVGIIQFIEGLKRRTRQRKDTFALVAWTGASIFFRPSDSGTPHSWTFRFGLGLILPALLVSGLWTWIELYYCFFLVLQFTRDRLWDFLASIIKWANSYNKSHIFLWIDITYRFRFSEKPWLTHQALKQKCKCSFLFLPTSSLPPHLLSFFPSFLSPSFLPSCPSFLCPFLPLHLNINWAPTTGSALIYQWWTIQTNSLSP